MSDLEIIRAGLVPYTEAWEMQERLHAERVDETRPDTVLLLEHPSVYTAGKRTLALSRPTDGTPVVEVDRGGDITWHGPGQIVGYPIVRLPDPIDVIGYVRLLESIIIDVCADFSVPTERVKGRTGVWVLADERGPERKIAAIGIRVAKRVTMHGFALNCDPDLTEFDRIVPCGISDASVTSLSKELGRQVPTTEVIDHVEERLRTSLVLAPRQSRSPRAPVENSTERSPSP